jgi:hypothetical protein
MSLLKASDYIPAKDFAKFLITGDVGTGKSEFAATFPTPGFVFNFDHKIATYARYPGWDYAEWDISAKGWVDFEKDEREVAELCKTGKYKTIVYDSTTAMTDMAMERALQLDPKRSATSGPIWNVHYQMVRNLIEGKLRAALNYKTNLVVIAHLNIQTDQTTGAIIGIEPLLTGQLAVRVPGYFEEVYCSFTRTTGEGKTQWYLRTIPRGYYKARSTMSGRTSLLPAELPNSYSAVIKAYHEAVAKQKEAIAKIIADRGVTDV